VELSETILAPSRSAPLTCWVKRRGVARVEGCADGGIDLSLYSLTWRVREDPT